MKHLLLLAGGSCVDTSADLIVHWEGQDVPEGEIALDVLLAKDLLSIRTEHAAWAYDMARLSIGRRELQAWLLSGESLSFWWCSLLYERHPKMTPGLYPLYKLRALERFLDEQQVTSICLQGGDARLRRTLEHLCASSSREFSIRELSEGDPIQSPKPFDLVRRLYLACPAPLRAALRYVHWWWNVRRKLPMCKDLPGADIQGKTATITTYFPNIDMQALRDGRFRSRYWESLHDVLNTKAEAVQASGEARGHFVRWLFIRFPAPQMDLAQCCSARDIFRRSGKDGLSFHYLEEFLDHKALWAAALRFVRLCLASLRTEKAFQEACRFPGSRLDFRDYVKEDWVESFRGWRGLERCLQYRAFKNYVTRVGTQRWTLFPLENCPWERMLTHLVHEAGNGPVFGAQHSTIRPTDFRYFDDARTFSASDSTLFQPDNIGGNGASAREQWLAAGLPEDRFVPIEALRYLYLRRPAAEPDESIATLDLCTPCSRHLLVLTSFFTDETEAHLALLAKAVQAGFLDRWDVTIKPHPYLPVADRLYELLGEQAARIRLADGPMNDYLRTGVTVWTSNSTTAALEAALRRLPLMVMAPSRDFDLCPLQDMPGLIRTATLEDVRRALQEEYLLQVPDDYLYLDTTLAHWKRWLRLG